MKKKCTNCDVELSTFYVLTISGLCKECRVIGGNNSSVEKIKNFKNKYSHLNFVQVVCYLFMIFDTGYFIWIYSNKEFTKYLSNQNIFFHFFIYIGSIVILYGITEIINFLFDIDKNQSNNTK